MLIFQLSEKTCLLEMVISALRKYIFLNANMDTNV